MDSATRELFRHCLLQQLDAVGSVGVPVVRLQLGARVKGFEPTAEEVRDELQYLADAGMVATVDRPLSPENVRWRITKDGRDYLAAQGLA